MIDLYVRSAHLGRTSLRELLEVHRGADHLVSGELIYVIASAAERRPTPIPAFLRESIFGYETTAPEQA